MYEKFFYIWLRYNKTDGNDIYLLNHSYPFGENIWDTNLDKAALFSEEQANLICNQNKDFGMILFQDAQRIACHHVKATKLKKEVLETGEACFLLSKRDQCGKNASFWFIAGRGYSSDVRCAQVFSYSEERAKSCRSFEYFVKASKAIRLSEKRIDVQDIAESLQRLSHHSVKHCLKTIKEVYYGNDKKSDESSPDTTE